MKIVSGILMAGFLAAGLVAARAADVDKAFPNPDGTTVSWDHVEMVGDVAESDGYNQAQRERLIAEGGCKADVLPTYYAAGCWAYAAHNLPGNGVGSSGGGSGD